MIGYAALDDWKEWAADQVWRFAWCCGREPEVFVADGAEHTGLDLVVRCGKCGRENYTETGDPRKDCGELAGYWLRGLP